jgi:hypothetical protein
MMLRPRSWRVRLAALPKGLHTHPMTTDDRDLPPRDASADAAMPPRPQLDGVSKRIGDAFMALRRPP